MPSSDTDIPHVSFTHHRIAVHEKLPKEKSDHDRLGGGIGSLRVFLDNPRLSALDKNRSLGLAYLEVGKEEKDPGRSAQYRSKGFELLAAAHAAGLPDPVLEAKLARLYFEQEHVKAMPLAQMRFARTPASPGWSVARPSSCWAGSASSGTSIKKRALGVPGIGELAPPSARLAVAGRLREGPGQQGGLRGGAQHDSAHQPTAGATAASTMNHRGLTLGGSSCVLVTCRCLLAAAGTNSMLIVLALDLTSTSVSLTTRPR